MATIPDKKITQEQSHKISIPLLQDLTAYYKILNEAVVLLLNQAEEEGWTPDRFINEVEGLFEDGGDSIEKG